MTHRATITLDEDVFEYLQTRAGRNRSAYINALIKKDQADSLAAAVLRANHEEATDREYQRELSDWDATMLDGLAP